MPTPHFVLDAPTIKMSSSEGVLGCGSAVFPFDGRCGQTVVTTAARAAQTLGGYVGVVESLEFQAVCGPGAPCAGTPECNNAVLKYCLNPSHVNTRSGAADALDDSARSLQNYPILFSETCQNWLRELIVSSRMAATAKNDTTTAPTIHSALTAFCSVYGASVENASTGVAYSPFLEPAMLVAELSGLSRSASNALMAQPRLGPDPMWRIFGFSFPLDGNPDAAAQVVLSSSARDVMALSLDVPSPAPPLTTVVEDGRVRPYAARAVVAFRIVNEDGSALVAPNGVPLTSILADVAVYNSTNYGGGPPPDSTQFVIRARTPREVWLPTGTGSVSATLVPELSGAVVSCSISTETGIAELALRDVYVNSPQIYATSNANCDCFAPVQFRNELGATSGANGETVHFVESTAAVLATNIVERNSATAATAIELEARTALPIVPHRCRYAWSEIPNPANAEYAFSQIGEFVIRVFKNLNLTNSALASHPAYDIRAPTASNPRVFVANGALELTGPSPMYALRDLCACHLPQQIYDSFNSHVARSGVAGQRSVALFPGCAVSSFPAFENTPVFGQGPLSGGFGSACWPQFFYDPSTQRMSSINDECLVGAFLSPAFDPASQPNPGPAWALAVSVIVVGTITLLVLVAILIAVILRGRALRAQ